MRAIVIAGGGTGGHVYPAIAIADEIVASGLRETKAGVKFIGSKRGLEATAVPAAGYSIELLHGRGIPRRFNMAAISAAMSLVGGFAQALYQLARLRPAAVVSVGGYAAAPAVFSAVILRIPVVIVEANAAPGLVHRLASRFAAASAIAWPGTHLKKATVTGNPVRSSLSSLQRTDGSVRQAKQELGFDPDLPLIACLGGSLGAKKINECVARLSRIWQSPRASLLHVTGRRDWEFESLRAKSSPNLEVVCVPYQDRMDLVYQAADVVLCRAGATTVAELAVTATPSILVPLPNAPGDHQTANARVLTDHGAAELIANEDLAPDELAVRLAALLHDEARLNSMRAAAARLARPNAAELVVQVVRSTLKESIGVEH